MNSLKILREYFQLARSARLNEHLLAHYGASANELVQLAEQNAAISNKRHLSDSGDLAQISTNCKLNPSLKIAEIYPAACDVFRAFALTQQPKVLILGQDPYHDGCACGLAFASRAKVAPSLKTIAKELALEADYHQELLDQQNCAELAKSVKNVPLLDEDALVGWAKQGVMLLNAALSVAPANPGSHSAIWSDFTSYVLEHLRPAVALLWGAQAQKFAALLDKDCKILCAAHPSPLARGKFYGCGHFLLANEILKAKNLEQIKWY